MKKIKNNLEILADRNIVAAWMGASVAVTVLDLVQPADPSNGVFVGFAGFVTYVIARMFVK